MTDDDDEETTQHITRVLSHRTNIPFSVLKNVQLRAFTVPSRQLHRSLYTQISNRSLLLKNKSILF